MPPEITQILIMHHRPSPPQVLGPRLMENRKPLHLQNTLVMYNAIQVVFSAWLFYEVSNSAPNRSSLMAAPSHRVALSSLISAGLTSELHLSVGPPGEHTHLYIYSFFYAFVYPHSVHFATNVSVLVLDGRLVGLVQLPVPAGGLHR